MIYVCDKCGCEFNDEPGYLAYGIKGGKPFIKKLCKSCFCGLTKDQLDSLEKGEEPVSFAEELGILGK